MKFSLRNLSWENNLIKTDVLNSFSDAIDQSAFIHGSANIQFENSFANYCGTKYAIGVSSGTDALSLTLKGLGIENGDEVITTPLTFIATLEAIFHVGAKPVLVDVDSNGLIDINQINKAISSRTKALLPVHIYGMPCNIAALEQIAKKNDLSLIFDAAQAHGSKYDNKIIGPQGDATCFSFMPAKSLGCFGDGGMVVTNNEKLALRIKSLRDHGRENKYEHKEIGFCSRLDNLQALVLLEKLKHLEDWIQKKLIIAKHYLTLLDQKNVTIPFQESFLSSNRHSYYVFPIFINGNSLIRKTLQTHLSNKGIETGVYYPIPCHMQKACEKLGYKKGDFPIAEKLCETILALPMNPSLSINEVEQISKIFNQEITRLL